MAFVSESVIDRWFDPVENSWVYRGFCYLFQNPLWNKKLPKGFSLCPYFWLSVFSWTLFRVFIFGVAYPIIGLGKLLYFMFGKPAVVLNSKINDMAKDLALPALIVIILFAILAPAAIGIMLWWWTLGSAFLQTFVVLAAINLGILIPALIYTENNRYKTVRCRPLFYLLPVGLASMAILFIFFPAQILAALSTSGWGILVAIKGMCKFALTSLVFAIKWVGIGIWFAIKWVGIGIWFALSYAIFGIAVGLWLIALGALSTVLMKVVDVFDKKAVEKKAVDRSINAYHWQSFAYNVFVRNEEWIDDLTNKILWSSLKLGMINGKARENLARRIAQKIALDVIFGMKWNGSDSLEVPKELIGISQLDFEACQRGFVQRGESVPEQYYDAVHKYFEKAYTAINAIDVGEVGEKIVKSDADIQRRMENYRHRYEVAQKREARCARNTEVIKRISSKIVKFLAFPLIVLWRCFKTFINGVWFVLKEIGRLLVYLWIVLKHVKQGACPYRRFEHIEKPKDEPKKPEAPKDVAVA